ncbi:MAG: ABC transporter ATP-binding protein [Alphaproteobacteria bacterium]|nr:ABC transporter ATP-binding protein [Alphaproteobacteria bacterium]MBT4710717.1 ABC transporter ATP-binding protein [Alphaproteobacteria bacterium]
MIEVDALSKRFGDILAVDNVSFSVAKGEVLGFLGPNGAGKSTSMRVITGYLPPSSGTARVLGEDIRTNPVAVKEKIGYLPEGAPLYGDMTVKGFLEFIASIRNLSRAAGKRRISDVVERMGLERVMFQRIETLSKGFKRRVGLAQAILHDPEVLILDEPTDGLDPNQKHQVRELIKEMGESKAIIISTHILEEVDAACTRAVIIDQGKVVLDGTPEQLHAKSPTHNAVVLRVGSQDGQRATKVLRDIGHVSDVETGETIDGIVSLMVVPSPGHTIAEGVAAAVRESNIEVAEMRTVIGKLDEVFRQLTVGEEAGAR